MTAAAIAATRLHSQQIAAPGLRSARDVVQWMGAMQAQDFPMSRWAVGLRLPGATAEAVELALARGEVLRTHLLRPTWHLVSSADVRWLLALTGPRIRASLRSRHRQLELSREVIRRSNRVIEKTLRDGRHSGRARIVELLAAARIRTDENRASHLLLIAELDGIACSGPLVGGKPTYALLDERVPPGDRLHRDEALGRLARRYFASRHPATLADFAWWSGLTVRDATRAVGILGGELRSELLAEQTYWMPAEAAAVRGTRERLHLLPAYDEYTISYQDRGAALPSSSSATAISSNGIFYPLVVREGRAIGTWKSSRADGRVLVIPRLFEPPRGADARKDLGDLMRRACRRYGRFLEAEVDLDL